MLSIKFSGQKNILIKNNKPSLKNVNAHTVLTNFLFDKIPSPFELKNSSISATPKQPKKQSILNKLFNKILNPFGYIEITTK